MEICLALGYQPVEEDLKLQFQMQGKLPDKSIKLDTLRNKT